MKTALLLFCSTALAVFSLPEEHERPSCACIKKKFPFNSTEFTDLWNYRQRTPAPHEWLLLQNAPALNVELDAKQQLSSPLVVAPQGLYEDVIPEIPRAPALNAPTPSAEMRRKGVRFSGPSWPHGGPSDAQQNDPLKVAQQAAAQAAATTARTDPDRQTHLFEVLPDSFSWRNASWQHLRWVNQIASHVDKLINKQVISVDPHVLKNATAAEKKAGLAWGAVVGEGHDHGIEDAYDRLHDTKAWVSSNHAVREQFIPLLKEAAAGDVGKRVCKFCMYVGHFM